MPLIINPKYLYEPPIVPEEPEDEEQDILGWLRSVLAPRQEPLINLQGPRKPMRYGPQLPPPTMEEFQQQKDQLVRDYSLPMSFLPGPVGVAANVADIESEAQAEGRDVDAMGRVFEGLGVLPVVGGVAGMGRKLLRGAAKTSNLGKAERVTQGLKPNTQLQMFEQDPYLDPAIKEQISELRALMEEAGLSPEKFAAMRQGGMGWDEIINGAMKEAEGSGSIPGRNPTRSEMPDLPESPPKGVEQNRLLELPPEQRVPPQPGFEDISKPPQGLHPSMTEGERASIRGLQGDIEHRALRDAEIDRFEQFTGQLPKANPDKLPSGLGPEQPKLMPDSPMTSSIPDEGLARDTGYVNAHVGGRDIQIPSWLINKPGQGVMWHSPDDPTRIQQVKGAADKLLHKADFQMGPLEAYNSFWKGIVASLDASLAGVQLLAAGVRHPIAVGKALGHMMRAVADPQVLERFKRSNMADWTDAANDGVIFHHDNVADYTSNAENAPVIGGLIRRSNEMFTAGGDVARLNIYKSLKDAGSFRGMSTKERKDLGEWVNNITGTTSSTPSDLERHLLFAPRFFRAQLGAFLDLAEGGKVGSEARKSLGLLMGAAFMGTYAANAIRGKETDLDPDSPNFMRLRDVLGQDISLLGSWEPFIRTTLSSGKMLPGAELLGEQVHKLPGIEKAHKEYGPQGERVAENIGRTLRGKLNILPSEAISIVTQETPAGEALDFPMGMEEVLPWLGTLAMAHHVPITPGKFLKEFGPAATKAIMGQSLSPQEAKTLSEWYEGVGGTVASAFGVKASEKSLSDKRDDYVKDIGFVDPRTKEQATRYEDLPSKLQRGIKVDMKAQQLEPERQSKRTLAREVEEEREKLYNQQLERDRKFRSTGDDAITGPQWKAARRDRYSQIRGMINIKMKDPEFKRRVERVRSQNDEFGKALDQYYKLIEENTDEASGMTDPEYFDERDEFLAGLEPRLREYVTSSIGVERTPLEEEYVKDLDVLKDYRKVKDTIAEYMGIPKDIVRQIERLPSTNAKRQELEDEYGWREFQRELGRARDDFRNMDDRIHPLLVKWENRVPLDRQRGTRGRQ